MVLNPHTWATYSISVAKHALYHDHHWISGICVVLSKEAVKMLVRDAAIVQSYELIDDMAIGVLPSANITGS